MKTLTMLIQLSFYELLQIFQNHFHGDIPIIIRKVCLLYSNYEIDAVRVFTILSLSVYELHCQKSDNVTIAHIDDSLVSIYGLPLSLIILSLGFPHANSP